jgi:hypothetical protein
MADNGLTTERFHLTFSLDPRSARQREDERLIVRAQRGAKPPRGICRDLRECCDEDSAVGAFMCWSGYNALVCNAI